MSYINIKNSIPNFKKGIISFWFRVPKKSLDKLKEVADKENAGTESLPPLHGILPLVTFGELYNGHNYHLAPNEADGSYFRHHWVHNCDGWIEIGKPEGPIEYSTGSSIVTDEAIHADPSYIGILYIPPVEGSGGDGGGGGGGGNGGNGGNGGVGVAALEGGTPEKYLLAMKLQTTGYGTPKMMATKRSFFRSDESSGFAVFPDDCGEGDQASHCRQGIGCVKGVVAPGNPTVDITTIEDISSEVFRSGMLLPDYFQVAVTTEITPDKWHHVLVSFDLNHTTSATGTFVSGNSTGCECESEVTVTSPTFGDPCRIFIALDDVNCDGDKLTRGFNLGEEDRPGETIPKSLDKNDWLSHFTLQAYYGQGNTSHEIAWGVTGQVIDTTNGEGAEAPSYSFSGVVASEKGPFGIPAAENVENRILVVSMAEFLMFTDYPGNEFDLSIEENRRHFITAQGNNGFQLPTNASPLYIPMRKFAFGDPTTWEPGADNPAFVPPLIDPSAWPTAIRINGKATIAAIDFTKCQFNWQMGRNLGTSKSKVEHVGKVGAYYNDPKIG